MAGLLADLSEEPPSPNPTLIYSLYTGVYKPQMIRIASLLDVFTPLAGGQASAPEIAQACGCATKNLALAQADPVMKFT